MRPRLVTALVVLGTLAGLVPAASAAPRISHPSNASSVVVRVETGGGFVAVQSVLGQLPSFTLYGDGTVLVAADASSGAIARLRRARLSEPGVQAVLHRARAAGLLAARTIDFGDMGAIGVSDAPSTTLVVHAGGRTVTRSAYALALSTRGARLSPAQRRARRALARFISSLPTALHGAHDYTPNALAVFVTIAHTPLSAGTTTITWPLARDLATAGRAISAGLGYRCIAVRNADARSLLARLRLASTQSVWTMPGSPKRAYALVVRPLLPDERGCGSLAG